MTPAPKLDLLGAVAGFYAGHLVAHLQAAGLFAQLRNGIDATELAEQHGYDRELLHGVLEFVYQQTDLLDRDGSCYRVAAAYDSDYSLEFTIDKYVRSYGQCFAALEQSLRAPDLGRSLVRRDVEAAAYHRIQSPPNPVVMEIVERDGIRSLLDVGCGPATMLRQLAQRDAGFTGWGIDENRHMCAAARRAARQEGVGARVHILHGDARDIGRRMTRKQRASVEALQSKGLLNELFRNASSEGAAKYLRQLGALFPGRIMFVVDYYGVLTRLSEYDPKYQHTAVHDLIQLVTAQGVPPPDLEGWAAVYDEGGCDLEHAYEGDSQGIRWFVHVIRLGGER